ncbi:hypothetical protein OSJ18_22555, partial [Mycobacterium ulcerans]
DAHPAPEREALNLDVGGPALATTATLIRSNFLNDNSSHDRAQKVSPRTNGAAELYRRPEIFPRRAADLVAEPMRGGDVVTVSSQKRFATDEIGYDERRRSQEHFEPNMFGDSPLGGSGTHS